MEIHITDAKTLEKRKMLKIYHPNSYRKNTFLGETGLKNLIYVGFSDVCLNYNFNEHIALITWANKITHDKTCFPTDVTREELWESHKEYESNNFKLLRIREQAKYTSRERRILYFIDSIYKLILANKDIYLAYLSGHDVNTCKLLERYINYLQCLLMPKIA